MFSPLNSSYIWFLSFRYYREAQRNRYLCIAQQKYESICFERLEKALGQAEGLGLLGSDPDMAELLGFGGFGGSLDELHRRACSDTIDYLQDCESEIDAAIAAEDLRDDWGSWCFKSPVKSAVYEMLQLGPTSDEQAAALFRAVATLFACRIFQAAPEPDDKDWEIRMLSDRLYMGAAVQRRYLELVGMNSLMEELETLSRAAGKDEEGIAFDSFIWSWCDSWGISGRRRDEELQKAYLDVVSDKEAFRKIALRAMEYSEFHSPSGRFWPDVSYGREVVFRYEF
ncbi:Uncharacterised protein [Slackia heliotrinireducens]|uniref:Uncharacterized protein n=1 Tax=Slackia heliotrinireducens (strain ATCC 29202 / DSM 20476 / NCTC 11029 / RHS 1) TaxID=471855 RepID=C7N2H9_SLAHD|nr:hypothetical protein [Slackia heliotrinireducens]ACV23487.1 hypothetical protein Shel_24790 [Slackia heliotrinireducens DSM 20476]VEH02840.1 Uncharacterised protein [Slackia heliotrinireducens]